MRGGQAAVIAAAEVVCSDLLLLDAGDLVAADARLVTAAMARTNEAPLTGEPQPVEKQTGSCAPETPLADLPAPMERLDRAGSCAPPGARAAEDVIPGA